MSNPIVVVDYDPQWPKVFATIHQVLDNALRGVPVIAIEHVGSTSVPGLAAKPIIDVDVIVKRSDIDTVIAAMAAAGYSYLGDLGVADRHAFTAPTNAIRQNTYVVVDGCLSLRNHLALRGMLRANTDLRDEYAAVKRRLAAETDDIDVYVDGKSDVIRCILQQAGIGTEELDTIDDVNRL
jgi:GrpB-like predicted nucleotidyltransferase (UPF0157 family)